MNGVAGCLKVNGPREQTTIARGFRFFRVSRRWIVYIFPYSTNCICVRVKSERMLLFRISVMHEACMKAVNARIMLDRSHCATSSDVHSSEREDRSRAYRHSCGSTACAGLTLYVLHDCASDWILKLSVPEDWLVPSAHVYRWHPRPQGPCSVPDQ